jgi:hypothetical protein
LFGQPIYKVAIHGKCRTELLDFLQQIIAANGNLPVLYYSGSPGGLGTASAAYYFVHGFILRNDVVFHKEYRNGTYTE